MEGLQKEIVCERIFTPQDIATRSNAYRGSAYGLTAHSKTMEVHPLNRSEDVQQLYFVGGTVKPGGSIPFVLLSAQWACTELEKDFES